MDVMWAEMADRNLDGMRKAFRLAEREGCLDGTCLIDGCYTRQMIEEWAEQWLAALSMARAEAEAVQRLWNVGGDNAVVAH